MLMVFILGGVPSSFTDPATSPAVAGSTDLPAGALAAGAGPPGDSVLLPPQPTRARAKAPIVRENISNLLFFTEEFLLLNMYESQRVQGLKPLRIKTAYMPCLSFLRQDEKTRHTNVASLSDICIALLYKIP
jgi:hypothetical protein